MVTGGIGDNINSLDSTELLRPGSDWQAITSRLHRSMDGVKVTTVENRVLLSGEWLIIITLLHLPHTGPCNRGIWL